MLFLLISLLSFLLLLSKSLALRPLFSWATEMRLLFLLFCKESFLLFGSLRKCRVILRIPFRMCAKRRVVPELVEVEETEEMSVLDLPELTLECILSRLPPEGLCNMAGVCRALRDRCRSLWELHMKQKWERVIGTAAQRQWRSYLDSRKDKFGSSFDVMKTLVGLVSCVWPLSWLRTKIGCDGYPRSSLPIDSIINLYLSLESGQFWFPAQVYNRENGHLGFMLSCYDAELSYDRVTDTFRARYPPHGRRTIVVEDRVCWERLRIPPVHTTPHDLHISDCLNDLCPGDHIEIQWRRNKEFPYGWWYGVVGHLETCGGNKLHCHCHKNDIVMLEFNQYTAGSRWRRKAINRKDIREEGNETVGFYGGIRKLSSNEEISAWKKLWPSETLE